MSSKITVKLPRCKGCGICVAFCPKKVLGLSELGKVVIENPDDCIACGQCEMRCPDYAIFVDKIDDADKADKANNADKASAVNTAGKRVAK